MSGDPLKTCGHPLDICAQISPYNLGDDAPLELNCRRMKIVHRNTKLFSKLYSTLKYVNKVF